MHKPTRNKLALVAALCLGSAVCASAQSPTHRYSFNDPAGSSTFVDSVGGANGTLNNDFADNLTSASLDGSQLQLDGTGGYATLPGGLITGNSVTIEFWATYSPSNSVGTHTFGFGYIDRGTGDADCLEYSHATSGNYQMLGYTTWYGWGYAYSSPGLNCTKNIHVTAIVDSTHQTLYLYNWSTQVARYTDRYVPDAGPRNSLAFLGRSIDGDGGPPLNASINEFRIYPVVLPSSQIALNDATGPDRIISSPGILQALHFRAPTNYLVVGQLSQQALTGDFSSVTGLDLIAYGGATFTSSDTNILTISSNGVVKAVSGGIAQVVASYGLNVTNFLSVEFPRLVHRYSFNDPAGSLTFIDSVGAKNGFLTNDVPANPPSASLDGSQLQLDAAGGHAILPSRVIPSNSKGLQVTIEFWASYIPSNRVGTRTFYFGNTNTGDYYRLDYILNARDYNQQLKYETPFFGEATYNPTPELNGATNVHVTAIVDCTNNTLGVHPNNLYIYNGVTLVATEGIGRLKSTAFNDSMSLLGGYGSINEFRIYSGVLPLSQIVLNDASGPDSLVGSPGTLQALHFSAPTNSLAIHRFYQQALTGDFSSVTGLDLIAYGGATFTSSDTNILTIGTNGLVKAVGPGTAEVVASYGGVNVTNSLSVQYLPLIHRYSFTTDASDSINGANGTLMGSASVSGGQLVLDGSTGCYLDLPAPQINIAANDAVTFDAWVTFGNATPYAELFGFGSDNLYYSIACVPAAINGFCNWGISEHYASGPKVEWSHAWANCTAHITCALDPPTGTISIYRDGVLQVAVYDATDPISSIGTNYAAIGDSLYHSEPYLPASVDEFRIYTGALTPAQVALVQQAGPNSTNLDLGALSSIVVVPTNYPAYASLIPPVILANYANLANFNLLPTVTAGRNVTLSGPQGLVVTSSDPAIIRVNAQNMLTTGRPGTVTLTASYGGKTNSATVTVKNMAVLTHRYSFNTDGNASDSVGGADGTLQGNATVSGGQLHLTGNNNSYLQLPANLLQNYSAVTVDTWANLGPVQYQARLWEFADITTNEFFFAPAWKNGLYGSFFDAAFPWGGSISASPPLDSQLLHVTCEYGNGWLAVYINGVLRGSVSNLVAPASSAGMLSATLGHSPRTNDPGINGSIDEFRIYNGLLAPEEIVASHLLGPDQTLSPTGSLSVIQSSGNLLVNWPLANAGCSVQTSSNLSSPNWITLTNVSWLGSSNTWQISVPASGGAQFFRLCR